MRPTTPLGGSKIKDTRIASEISNADWSDKEKEQELSFI
jgi:hypothetical protein